MEVILDLDPEVLQLLDYHRARYQANQSDFLNYLIALYDKNTREYHQQQQAQYQQPQQRPVQYDNSGYLGPVEAVEPVQQSRKVCRDYGSVGNILHGTKPKATLVRAKSKTVPKRTAAKKIR